MLTLECIICGSSFRDSHVKLLKCAGPQDVADALTKSLPRPALFKHRQYMWGTRIPFSAFYLSQDWTAPDGVLQYHHTMRIPSRTRRLRNVSSVCVLVCMCVLCVDMTHDAMIDTGRERNRV